MIEINPDPYKDGDPLGPTGRVTAIFDSSEEMNETLSSLAESGFHGADAALFMGPEAAKKFDANGVARGMVGLKLFQNAICDEKELFDEFEEALNHGGAVVAVRTGNDEHKKKQVVSLLKSHHARKINYWGNWHYEALG